MKKKFHTIPVIDLFAGPGGLGEGFSALKGRNGNPCFEIVLSIENDANAHRTLELRSFFRQFKPGMIPEEYYRYLRDSNDISRDELFSSYPVEAEKAQHQAWWAQLGEPPPETKPDPRTITTPQIVDNRINEALGSSKTADRWILIGGPPCQAYSIAGRSRMAKCWEADPSKRDNDPRYYLYREYIRIIAAHHPPLFVMENVRGMLSAKLSDDSKIIDRILPGLSEPSSAFDKGSYDKVSYRLHSFVVQSMYGEPRFDPKNFLVRCEDYGIPQARHRVIILGIRSDIEVYPQTIEPSKRIVKMDRLIDDLPIIRSGISEGEDSGVRWKSNLEMLLNGAFPADEIEAAVYSEMQKQIKNVQADYSLGDEFIKLDESPYPRFAKEWFLDPRIEGVCNHHARTHMVSDLHRYFFAACFAKVKKRSPKLKDFPEFLLPSHENVKEGVAGKNHSDRFRVQLSDRPALTITSHIHKDGHYFIHPDPKQCRSLTVREAARLQTFPDNYFFVGKQGSQYTQVGNAVPPLLANKLADKVYRLMKAANL